MYSRLSCVAVLLAGRLCAGQPVLTNPITLEVSVTVGAEATHGDASSELPEGFWYQWPPTMEWQQVQGVSGSWEFAGFDYLQDHTGMGLPVRGTWQTEYHVTVYEVRTGNAAQAQEAQLREDDPACAFLDPASPDVGWVMTQCPDLQSIVGSLGAEAGTTWERAKRTWDYIHTNHGEYGKCWFRSSLFCALMRQQRVPARLIGGVCSRAWAHHLWAEYYLAGYGWVPVDWIPGSGFDVVSAKHLLFWRGSPSPKPRNTQLAPTDRPVVRGQTIESKTPLTVTYKVNVIPVTGNVGQRQARASAP